MVIAKVAFEYAAAESDELTLNVGDIVTNIKVEDGGWWEGELDGKRGVFPENFVVVIEEAVQSPAPSIPPAKPAAVTSKKKFARVTFQYDAVQPDELNLNVGNLVEVLEEEDEGWWKGKLNDKIGMFPSNFVELITEEPAEPATLPEPMEPVVVSPTTAQPNDIKTTRPKSQVGLVGWNRDKLKKTGKSVTGTDPAAAPPTQPSKPPQPSKPAEPEKKAAALPVPAASHYSAPKEMKKSVLKAKVLFAYEPEQKDELKLAVGDIITIVNKDVFEGWMQGEHNGEIGLFPDNFVETLPVETVNVENNLEVANPVTQQKSIKRAAKADPSPEKAPDPQQSEKPKFGMGNAFGGGIQAELQKKLAAGKPLAPGPPLKPAKAGKPPPAKPTKPKPPAANKPAEPPALSQANRTSSLSRHEEKPPFMKRTTSESRKNPPKPPPPVAAASAASAISNPEPEQSPKAKEEQEFDFDAVKSNDQLKHMQRAKPPSKHPPSKFKNGVSESGESAVTDSKEVEELKKQVKHLQEKMSEMEKRFQQLTKQVLEDLAKSNKEQSAQQIDIDCLKKQVELLTK